MKFIKKEIEKTIDDFVTEYYEFQKRYYNYIHYGTTMPSSILNHHYIVHKCFLCFQLFCYQFSFFDDKKAPSNDRAFYDTLKLRFRT